MRRDRVRVELGDRSYDVVVGEGAWDLLGEALAAAGRPSRTVVVSDRNVAALYGEEVVGRLRGFGAAASLHEVPAGEGSKSFAELERLCRGMAVLGLERASAVVALGGGVVGDLAGLAASLYLRGVPCIQLPTSLLAMVDSSVGGKTAINIPEGKNLVGAFLQPVAVLADLRALGTLDHREWYSGMAEVLKVALTLDPALFNDLEALPGLGPGLGAAVRAVGAACRRKAEVVRQDEREAGPRRVLNFGHTLGHALEAAGGYGRMRHGEAVAAGMRAALSASVRLCGLPPESRRRALAVLDRIPMPPLPSGEDLASFMARDKKSAGGRLQAVLLEEIGRPRIVELADPSILVRGLFGDP